MTIENVREAAGRISGQARRTPVLTSRTFDERTGVTAFFKCESFQQTGSFKFRGAYNALCQLSPDEGARGVLTYSSGNHAQALAKAGRLLGIRVTVVMPADAPEIKRKATEGYGARIVLYDRDETTRERLGGQIAQEEGLNVVPPYDHPAIVAGQGTVGLELVDEVGPLDWLLIPCGGGGLLSGCTVSAKALSPGCKVVGVEPAAGDDACRSFKSGTLQSVKDPATIADGARTPSLGEIPWEIVRTLVDDMVSVTDPELIAATGFLWERMKIVVEPTGALAAAAVLTGKVPVTGRVGIVVSGGNVDVGTVARLIAGQAGS
ncbi:MAG: threo-3-hydroxy-L-aspartate ammonia-lyase [Fimbriimonadaceae bacterium]|nr:threo-3-hydroxy-L-aspartate ammonia-lyase [Fimbriimonadaceae bacterium]QYK54777.1 MAG: threo-3-hydroxy-L-aspartate ammonia-lyase [Fimbriimonadaceae bacterium]